MFRNIQLVLCFNLQFRRVGCQTPRRWGRRGN